MQPGPGTKPNHANALFVPAEPCSECHLAPYTHVVVPPLSQAFLVNHVLTASTNTSCKSITRALCCLSVSLGQWFQPGVAGHYGELANGNWRWESPRGGLLEIRKPGSLGLDDVDRVVKL